MTETIPSLSASMAARLEALAPQLETIRLSPNGTIVPDELHDLVSEQALALFEAAQSNQGGLTLGGTLGEGGMGIVRTGTQVSLGRAVAIKTLRAACRAPRDVQSLLREAWVTGALEHPNILPIYELRVDKDDLPLVVLKHIEGEDWGDVLKQPEKLPERLGKGDPLERNLEVLMQVCRAVSFAHEHGIVHRDIKPDNVRIGSFGEVYLLDWGIAVAIQDDGSGRFPLAKNATEMAGTPTYLAPEMLGDPGLPAITTRTDIYLLGATLHEVVTGKAPHDKGSHQAMLASVLLPNFTLKDVPLGLAQIVRRAMAFNPEDRFKSADAFRDAIAGFLTHRGADRLVQGALACLHELESFAGRASEQGGEDLRVEVHDRLGACRAGFSAALDVHPDNEEARAGLQRAVSAAANYELDRGDARAARKLTKQLKEPTDALVQRLESGLMAQRASEVRRHELEALGKDLDPETGTRSRALVGVAFGVLVVAMQVVGTLTIKSNSYASNVGTTGLALLAGLALFAWGRKPLTATAYNRRLSATVMIALVTNLLATVGGILLDVPASTLTVFYMLIFAACGALISTTTERRFWPVAVGYAIAFLAAAAFPHLRLYFLTAGHFFLTITFMRLWGLPALQKLRPRSDDDDKGDGA